MGFLATFWEYWKVGSSSAGDSPVSISPPKARAPSFSWGSIPLLFSAQVDLEEVPLQTTRVGGYDSGLSESAHLLPLATVTGWDSGGMFHQLDQSVWASRSLPKIDGSPSQQTWAWPGVRLQLLRAVGSSKDPDLPEPTWMGVAWKWRLRGRVKINRRKLSELLNQAMSKAKIPGF